VAGTTVFDFSISLFGETLPVNEKKRPEISNARVYQAFARSFALHIDLRSSQMCIFSVVASLQMQTAIVLLQRAEACISIGRSNGTTPLSDEFEEQQQEESVLEKNGSRIASWISTDCKHCEHGRDIFSLWEYYGAACCSCSSN
jgi:hypothetical protein